MTLLRPEQKVDGGAGRASGVVGAAGGGGAAGDGGAQGPASSVEQSASRGLEMLCGMGFDQALAARALAKTNGDAEASLELLLAGEQFDDEGS